jgi:hypothetical protein
VHPWIDSFHPNLLNIPLKTSASTAAESYLQDKDSIQAFGQELDPSEEMPTSPTTVGFVPEAPTNPDEQGAAAASILTALCDSNSSSSQSPAAEFPSDNDLALHEPRSGHSSPNSEYFLPNDSHLFGESNGLSAAEFSEVKDSLVLISQSAICDPAKLGSRDDEDDYDDAVSEGDLGLLPASNITPSSSLSGYGCGNASPALGPPFSLASTVVPWDPERAMSIDEQSAFQLYSHIDDNIYLKRDLGFVDEQDDFPCGCFFDPSKHAPNKACGPDSGCINRQLFIECTPGMCPSGRFCQNRRMQYKQSARVEIVRTEKKGYGLLALADLPTGAFVFEYVGEVIPRKTFLRRAKVYAQEGHRHFYFMSLQKDEVIDAQRKGGVARFINHSCNPNCETQKWVVGNRLRIGLFTKRPIALGEELTFDYKFERYGAKAQICYCGEKNCSGIIGAASSKRNVDDLEAQMKVDGDESDEPLSDNLSEGESEDDVDSSNISDSKKIHCKRKGSSKTRRGGTEDWNGQDESRKSMVDDEIALRKILRPILASNATENLPALEKAVDKLLYGGGSSRLKIFLRLSGASAMRLLLNAFMGVPNEDPAEGGEPTEPTEEDTPGRPRRAAAQAAVQFSTLPMNQEAKDDPAVAQTKRLRKTLELLAKLPISSRNTIENSNLGTIVTTLTDHPDDLISHSAKRIITSWSNLQTVYRIPKKLPVSAPLETKEIPDEEMSSSQSMDIDSSPESSLYDEKRRSRRSDTPESPRSRKRSGSRDRKSLSPSPRNSSSYDGHPERKRSRGYHRYPGTSDNSSRPPFRQSISIKLPPNWTVAPATSNSAGHMYLYYNTLTRETRWDPPPGAAPLSASASDQSSQSTEKVEALTADEVAAVVERARRAAQERRAAEEKAALAAKAEKDAEEVRRLSELAELKRAKAAKLRLMEKSKDHRGKSKPEEPKPVKSKAHVIPPERKSNSQNPHIKSKHDSLKKSDAIKPSGTPLHSSSFRALVGSYVVKQLTKYRTEKISVSKARDAASIDVELPNMNPLSSDEDFKRIARSLTHEVLEHEPQNASQRHTTEFGELSEKFRTKVKDYVKKKTERMLHKAKKAGVSNGDVTMLDKDSASNLTVDGSLD